MTPLSSIDCCNQSGAPICLCRAKPIGRNPARHRAQIMLALVYPAFVGLLASANVVQSGFTGLVVPAHVLTESVVLGHAFEPTVFNDRVLKARKPCATGEILFEWHEGACLTAAAAYSDLDVGRHLRDIAPRVGPGFETVAIATLLAGEWVRDFRWVLCNLNHALV